MGFLRETYHEPGGVEAGGSGNEAWLSASLSGEHGDALRETLRSSARSGEPSRELEGGVLRSERVEGARVVLSSLS